VPEDDDAGAPRVTAISSGIGGVNSPESERDRPAPRIRGEQSRSSGSTRRSPEWCRCSPDL
jgi:hypothetical protein